MNQYAVAYIWGTGGTISIAGVVKGGLYPQNITVTDESQVDEVRDGQMNLLGHGLFDKKYTMTVDMIVTSNSLANAKALAALPAAPSKVTFTGGSTSDINDTDGWVYRSGAELREVAGDKGILRLPLIKWSSSYGPNATSLTTLVS